MLTSVRFQNFRILRSATLPLTRSTLLLGPNGSGKSTALQGLQILQEYSTPVRRAVSQNWFSAGINGTDTSRLEIEATWDSPAGTTIFFAENDKTRFEPHVQIKSTPTVPTALLTTRIFSLDADAIASPVQVQPDARLADKGENLAMVLTLMQDQHPEHFDSLNEELSRWLPQFDRILFDTPSPGARGFMLRTAAGRHPIKAAQLSHGTLFALTLLTLTHLPTPPEILCLEEPDRGIHPRLLRNVYDAIQRLAFPEASGDDRKPTQIICTSHSPYLLDFYRDHPQDVVLSEITSDGAVFKQLSTLPHIEEILDDSSLGDAWYSGILGGVPVKQ